MKAKDVMTHCVVSIAPDASIRDAIARMITHEVSGLPVIDASGRLVGIVSEGDFVHRVEMHSEPRGGRWIDLLLDAGSRAEEYARSHGRIVRDVMSTDVVTAGPETTLAEIVRLMDEHGIKRVPVVDGDRVVGIVSRADLMSALAKVLAGQKQREAEDDVIRAAILSRIRGQSWCHLHQVKVAVRQGAVDLKGTIFDERQRRALHTLVETVPGVKAVHDHLTKAEPMSAAVVGSPP